MKILRASPPPFGGLGRARVEHRQDSERARESGVRLRHHARRIKSGAGRMQLRPASALRAKTSEDEVFAEGFTDTSSRTR